MKTIYAPPAPFRYPAPSPVDRKIWVNFRFDRRSPRRPLLVRIVADDEATFSTAANKAMKDLDGVSWGRY